MINRFIVNEPIDTHSNYKNSSKVFVFAFLLISIIVWIFIRPELYLAIVTI